MTMFYPFIISMKEVLYDVSNLLKTNVKLLVYLVFTLVFTVTHLIEI